MLKVGDIVTLPMVWDFQLKDNGGVQYRKCKVEKLYQRRNWFLVSYQLGGRTVYEGFKGVFA